MANRIKIKRVYDPSAAEDGVRILVDRLWPRGIKKEDLPLDLWAKEIAPGDALRKSFGHRKSKFSDFKDAYVEELSANPEGPAFVEEVKTALLKGNVTLLYSAKDTEANQAVVLKNWLEAKMSG